MPAPRGDAVTSMVGRLRRAGSGVRHRLDRTLEQLGEEAARRRQPAAETVRLEYPSTADPVPRWGWGRPVHRGLDERFAAGHDRFLATMRGFAEHIDDLTAIRRDGADGPEPCWRNEWLPGLDTVALYGFLRARRPARYLEIGSGQSTKVVARARRDGGVATTIVSVDPQPRAEVDALCDEVVRAAAELVDVDALVAPLRAGDIVFFDGSHRVLPGSDCTAFFLDVLPAIPPGVLVGVHDVYLPVDYPDGFFGLWWSEQYLLAALLLADGPGLEVALPAYYVSEQPELAAPLEPLWSTPALDGVQRHGSSFWLETR